MSSDLREDNDDPLTVTPESLQLKMELFSERGFDYENKCLFCNDDASEDYNRKLMRKQGKVKNLAVQAWNYDTCDKILQSTYFNESDERREVRQRIQNQNLVELKARYHRLCYAKFVGPYSMSLRDKPKLEDKMSLVYNYVDDTLGKGPFSIRELQQKLDVKLSDRILKRNLIEHYGKCLLMESDVNIRLLAIPTVILQPKKKYVLKRKYMPKKKFKPQKKMKKANLGNVICLKNISDDNSYKDSFLSCHMEYDYGNDLNDDDLTSPCHGCLSTGRKVSPLGGFQELFSKITDLGFDNLSEVQLCWECMGVLRKVNIFKERVLQAHEILADSNNQNRDALSNIYPIEAYNITLPYSNENNLEETPNEEIPNKKIGCEETSVKQEVIDIDDEEEIVMESTLSETEIRSIFSGEMAKSKVETKDTKTTKKKLVYMRPTSYKSQSQNKTFKSLDNTSTSTNNTSTSRNNTSTTRNNTYTSQNNTSTSRNNTPVSQNKNFRMHNYKNLMDNVRQEPGKIGKLVTVRNSKVSKEINKMIRQPTPVAVFRNPIQTEVGSHQCTECDAKFAQKAALTSHMKLHRPEVIYLS